MQNVQNSKQIYSLKQAPENSPCQWSIYDVYHGACIHHKMLSHDYASRLYKE